jgi:hypothetical protein
VTTPLPELIVREVAARAATLSAAEASPWHGDDMTVTRPKPLEEVSPKHRLVQVIVSAFPAPVGARTGQNGQTHWTMSVSVSAFIEQAERADPEAEEDERKSMDELGFAAIEQMLAAFDVAEVFGGQGYQQLCDTVEVDSTAFGQQQESANFYGASLALRFTFQTASASLAAHPYPASP